MAALCLNFSSSAQNTSIKILPLNVGDKVPEEVWNLPLQVINNSEGKKNIRLSDYRHKLIILDFWATWCKPCIKQFPKLAELRRNYNGKLHVLGVAYENEKKLADFYQKQAFTDITASIVNDKVLSAYFPHKWIPHYIIIGKDGLIKTVTTAEYITAENIETLLNNGHSFGQVKYDFDPKNPLFISENYPKENGIVYYSILSRGSYSGLPAGSQFRKDTARIIGRALTNSTMLLIYETAVAAIFDNLKDNYNGKRVIFEVRDRSKIDNITNLEGKSDKINIYNYDIILPSEKADSLYHYMLRDLNAYTDYYGRIEKRMVKCLVLRRKNVTSIIKTVGGRPENTLFTHIPARLINCPLSYLINRVNEIKEIPYPVIDETQYVENVDLIFPNKIRDINDLKASLNALGLILDEEYRELNTFILSDRLGAN